MLGSMFVVLGGLGDRFSDFLSVENRLENEGCFGDVTDPEPGIWRGGSTHHGADLHTIWAL